MHVQCVCAWAWLGSFPGVGLGTGLGHAFFNIPFIVLHRKDEFLG